MFSLKLPKLSQSAVFRNFFTCVEESNNMKGYVWKSDVKLDEKYTRLKRCENVTAGTSLKNLIFYTNWFCIIPITDWYSTAVKQSLQ